MNNEKKLIDLYFNTKKSVHEIFNYLPDWKEIPMEDCREHYWMLIGNENDGTVVWSDVPLTKDAIESGERLYSGPIYTQRFLTKFVYRSEHHVMISVDTQTDGNKFLMIFSSDKEETNQSIKDCYSENW